MDLTLPLRAAQRLRTMALTRFALPTLRDPSQEARFTALAPRFYEVRERLAASRGETPPGAPSRYAWGDWEREVAERFRTGVPVDFLHDPTLAHTMFFGATGRLDERLSRVRTVFPGGVAEDLLLEDAIGRPPLVDFGTLTSANRAHHAYHLATHALVTEKSIFAARTVVEWGGGYGNMARIVRRMNRAQTYVILDIPALSALQWVYLSALEGESATHLVTADDPTIREGAINLVSSAFALEALSSLRADAFISTWALTESPQSLQHAVVDKDFFGASQLLVGYAINDDNHVRDALAARGCVQRALSILAREGAYQNEYSLR